MCMYVQLYTYTYTYVYAWNVYAVQELEKGVNGWKWMDDSPAEFQKTQRLFFEV